ncbi:MAG: acetate kinase [Bifidobacteriaceae bacterium]|jgi:acetate kinase|nr:acetate kinase [Bifidobacteriaceae bacterium]
MATVFVVNAGSSSLKYQLIDLGSGEAVASGSVERIGEDVSTVTHKGPDGVKHRAEDKPAPDHTVAMRAVVSMFGQYGPSLDQAGICAVGHRVVQGGAIFDGPTLVTPEVKAQIQELAPLAPLHNPAALLGIAAAEAIWPDLPQVAVFDTAFHQTLPPEVYTYAIPRDLAAKHRIRRYGAHGTSHKYVSVETAKAMGRDPKDVNVIVVHAGSGASVCAVRGGKSVEVSMGLTPLEGLVMGSRCGDIDPAILFLLAREEGMDTDQLDEMCNKKSGLIGLTGTLDMRDIRKAADAGDEAAQLAIHVFCHRIRAYIGNYMAQLGHVDAIAWTAGIGENTPEVREEVCGGLDGLGIDFDAEINQALPPGTQGLISRPDSRVQVWVVPTNEELEIARETAGLIGR